MIVKPESPELRKLYMRVIRRVHPDGAIDEQDRQRCERLTQEANRAYEAGDEAALRAVIDPKARRSGSVAKNGLRRQRFSLWSKPLAVGAAAALALVLFLYYVLPVFTHALPPSRVQQQGSEAELPQRKEDTHITDVPPPPMRKVTPPQRSTSLQGQNAGSDMYIKEYLGKVKSLVEKNFDQYALNAPEGTHVDIAVVIHADGQPETPHLVISSRDSAVDLDCLQSVEKINSFGETPTRRPLTVNLRCSVKAP